MILGNPCPVSLSQVAACNHHNACLSTDKGGKGAHLRRDPVQATRARDAYIATSIQTFGRTQLRKCISIRPTSSDSAPAMHHDSPPTNFSDLREEFRVLQSGFRRKNAMAEPALNNSWLTNALLGASERRTESDPSTASYSSHLSPFRSSESSHSAAESERAHSEVTPTTIASGSDDLVAPLQPAHQFVAENGEGLLDGALVHQKSRKGHKKSREGCFNCKRRKIKVNINLKMMFKLTNWSSAKKLSQHVRIVRKRTSSAPIPLQRP